MFVGLSSFFLDLLVGSLSSESFRGNESLDLRSLGDFLSFGVSESSLGGVFRDEVSQSLSFFGILGFLFVDVDQTELLQNDSGSLGAESLGQFTSLFS